PDGRRVVVWSADRRLRAYDLPESGPLAPRAVVANPPADHARRPPRKPVPDAATLAKADAAVREAYKADFARKLPADRRKLAERAAAALGKAGQATPARDAEARVQQLKALRDEFEPVRRAAAALESNPDDPAAALVVGKYRAFVRRRWDDGLAILARGSDP